SPPAFAARDWHGCPAPPSEGPEILAEDAMLFREAIGGVDGGLVLLPPAPFLLGPHLPGQGLLEKRRQVQTRRLRSREELRVDGEIDRFLCHAHSICASVTRINYAHRLKPAPALDAGAFSLINPRLRGGPACRACRDRP